MKKKPAGLFEKKQFLMAFSLAAAAVCWLIVVMTQGTTTTEIIRRVPVRVDAQSEILLDLGLHPIETETQYVDVEVNGLSTVVGLLTPDDLTVVPRLNSVTEPATYDLSLMSGNQTPNPDYVIRSFSPSTVKLRFDRIERRSFNVEERINGLAIVSGYTEKGTEITPDVVNIEGPAAELDRISRCEIVAELTSPLDRTYAADCPIILYDENGDALDTEAMHLSLDVTDARLVIQVLKRAEIPLTVDYITPPVGFPLRELRDARASLSQDAVVIAGPEEIIDGMQQINLGYIDVRDITPDSNVFQYEVPLPPPADQFIRIDNVSSVALTFDLAGLESARFNVTDLRIVNAPIGYDPQILARTIPNVLFVGRTEILESMTTESIIAEVDLSERDIVSGSYTCPVKISVPGRGLVWAVGHHTVTVEVTALESGDESENPAL